MEKSKVRVNYERLSLDNLSQVFMLWEKAVSEQDRAYEKFGEIHKKMFLSNLAYSIDNQKFIGRVIRKGRKVIGFVLGEVILRKTEPMQVFKMDYYYLDKEYRGVGHFKKLMADLKLDFKIIGVTHIEIEDYSEEQKEIKGFIKSKTVHITEV